MKMNKDAEQHESDGSGKFHTVQPLRDLQSNWAVDLAKNLEEYLLKICSGEITSSDQDVPHLSINFAEAALLLQGSAQVYSRKVEYLHSLVLHALEFSRKSSQEQAASGSSQPGEDVDPPPREAEVDSFWDLDDITVEPKNLLDDANGKDAPAFVRPPANLVVFEGDCLDTSGDAGELESYLLATTHLYRDFLLLDQCDATAVNDFLKNKPGNQTSGVRGSSVTSKSRKSCLKSPTVCPGGTASKFSAAKNLDAATDPQPSMSNNDFGPMPSGGGFCPPDPGNTSDEENGVPDLMDSDDPESVDPWIPLNPHEPGTLKIKPYKRVKANNRKSRPNSQKPRIFMTEFPLAKPDGPISVELTNVWEQKCAFERQEKTKSPSRYEKLRQSLTGGSNKDGDSFFNSTDDEDNGDNRDDPEIDPPDLGMPETAYNDEDLPPENKDDHRNYHMDHDEIHEDHHANLEDLCRSHLDFLLANLAESEKQSEMATRVSTWKQRIEQSLEEEDSQPPFDIHEYGGRVLNKLSKVGGGTRDAVSFTNVVEGYEKQDVARTFSALLQLVNNGDVHLEKNVSKNGESFCYTSESPFYVRLLKNMKLNDEDDEMQPIPSKKRAATTAAAAKSTLSPKGFKLNKGVKHKLRKENHLPVRNNISSPDPSSSSTCGFSLKLRKSSGGSKCTPEGKKRRRFIESVNLNHHFPE